MRKISTAQDAAEFIEGVKETLEYLRGLDKRIRFVTNNSTKSRQSYTAKFKALGIHCDIKEMFGSSYATAIYLKNVLHFPSDKKVYVVGQQGVVDELSAVGIKSCGAEADKENLMSFNELGQYIQPDPQIGAVLCGFDFYINYTKLSKAYTYLLDPNCLFLATNTDSTFPTDGRTFPGTGSLVASLEMASGRRAVVLGKPHRPMLDAVLVGESGPRERICMVGDRLDTDIAFGASGGLGTLLVLTGVSNESDMHDAPAHQRPMYYADGLRVFGQCAK